MKKERTQKRGTEKEKIKKSPKQKNTIRKRELKEKIPPRKRNPFDDYLEELERYDKGTPKKSFEMED